MNKLKINKKNKLVLFLNDIVGLETIKTIKSHDDEVGFLFVHEEDKAKLRDEIISESNLATDKIFFGKDIEKEEVLEKIRNYNPDMFITCYWAYLLKSNAFQIPKFGCLNFHPALLPHNRGWYPSAYPFLNNTPAGVTLHLVDEGADTGPIVSQKKIEISPNEDSGDLYKKSQKNMIELFKETWMLLKTEGLNLIKQDSSLASYNSKSKIESFDFIDLEKQGTFNDFLNILKARNFQGRGFSYFVKNDKKYKISIKIEEEN